MPTTLTDPNVHYVKFRRGSVSVWNNLLLTPSNIDDDTLYFIYDTTDLNPKEGKLYLGQKLISGTGGGGSSGDLISLTDLTNVTIDGTKLENKQILVFNIETGQWENTSLSTIINTAVGEMVGATDSRPGKAGLVPAPLQGDNNRFLAGDGSWVDINIPTFDSNTFATTNNIVSLQGYNLASVGSTPIKTESGIQWSTMSPGRINKQITTLAKLQAQLNGEDLDPLDLDAIYLVASEDPDSSSNYDEYMIVNGALERLGSFGQVDLTNYVQIPTFNTAIGQIHEELYDSTDPRNGSTIPGLISRVTNIEATYVTQAQIGNLQTLLLSPGNTTLVEEVNTINRSLSDVRDRLKWDNLQD